MKYMKQITMTLMIALVTVSSANASEIKCVGIDLNKKPAVISVTDI